MREGLSRLWVLLFFSLCLSTTCHAFSCWEVSVELSCFLLPGVRCVVGTYRLNQRFGDWRGKLEDVGRKTLELGWSGVTNPELAVVAKNLGKTAKVSLGYNPQLSQGGLERFLKEAPPLRELDLRLAGAKPRNLLPTLLEHQPGLKYLAISGITESDLEKLKGFTELTELDLRESRLDAHDWPWSSRLNVPDLVLFLKDPPPKLKKITLPFLTESQRDTLKAAASNNGIEIAEEMPTVRVKLRSQDLDSLYDGDSPFVIFPDGAGYQGKQELRLEGIDTAEMKSEEPHAYAMAVAAKLRLSEVLIPAKEILVTVMRKDKFGGRLDAQVLADGVHVNRLLLDEGLAEPFDGTGDRTLTDWKAKFRDNRIRVLEILNRHATSSDEAKAAIANLPR